MATAHSVWRLHVPWRLQSVHWSGPNCLLSPTATKRHAHTAADSAPASPPPPTRRILRPTDVPDTGLLCDVLWADPDPNIRCASSVLTCPPLPVPPHTHTSSAPVSHVSQISPSLVALLPPVPRFAFLSRPCRALPFAPRETSPNIRCPARPLTLCPSCSLRLDCIPFPPTRSALTAFRPPPTLARRFAAHVSSCSLHVLWVCWQGLGGKRSRRVLHLR